MSEHSAYLGIGANLVPDGYESLVSALEAAIQQIDAITRVERCSAWYRTAPVPISDQPDYLNAVLKVATSHQPHDLLKQLNQIEARFGRVRTARNAARVLDIDILFFDTQIIADEKLEIPHPRLHQRAFVLRPLTEIAPELRHPDTGQTMEALYQEFLASADGGQECLPL